MKRSVVIEGTGRSDEAYLLGEPRARWRRPIKRSLCCCVGAFPHLLQVRDTNPQCHGGVQGPPPAAMCIAGPPRDRHACRRMDAIPHTPITTRAILCIRKRSDVFVVSLFLPHLRAHSGQGEPTRTRKRARQPPCERSPAARKMDKSPMTLHPHLARGSKISRAKRSELADLVSYSAVS